MIRVEEQVSTYAGLAEIGQGAFSSVYRAWQPTFERDVAIKVMSGSLDGAALARFEQECAAIGALSGHPNIVTVFDVGTSESGSPCIVMEFLPCGSLAERVLAEGTLPWDEVASIGIKLAGALESAHRCGVLHLDVKPENVLVSRFGEPKLTDFGLARGRGQEDQRPDVVWATRLHAAPEVLAGEAPTTAADVYSLASTLHSLLTGQPPFVRRGEADEAAVMVRMATCPPPDLRPGGVPDSLCRVLERALAKDPADRQAGAAQLGRQLQAVEATAGLVVTGLPIETDDDAPDPADPLPADPAPANDAAVVGPPATRPRGRRGRWGRRLPLLLGVVLMVAAVADLVSPASVVEHRRLPQVYADTFEVPGGWQQQDDDLALLGYDDGHYRMLVKQRRRQVLSDTAAQGPEYGVNLGGLSDVSVRVSAFPASGTGLFGLVCRREGGTGVFYEGLVGTDRSVRIVKYDGYHFVTLAESSGPLLPADRAVRLRLDCLGAPSETRLSLFVDGQPVGAAVDHQGLRQGGTGLVVASADAESANVTFDDLVILGAETSPRP